MQRNPSFIISTPGRLIDLLKNTKSFDLDCIEYLVFDEADILLDFGFELEMKELLKSINP